MAAGKLNKYYKKYQFGGINQNIANIDWQSVMDDQNQPKTNGVNWSNLAGTGVSLLSNLSNINRTLPTPQAPTLEDTINPSLVNFNADKLGLEKALRGVNSGIDRVSSNSGRANAQKVANFSNYLEERGKLAQAENNLNASIINNTNQFNTGVKARNVERQNSFKDALLARSLRQNQLAAENVSDIGNKIQASRRDNALMNLEEQKLSILPRVYKDSGVLNRNLSDLYDQQLNNYEMGGKIYIKPENRGTFTEAATEHGMGVQGFASKVLANKGKYSPSMVKKAVFAKNASKWNR